MQPDQNARCAFILTADARRYVALQYPSAEDEDK